jgi:transcriptional regulator with PAS, ATPase and Fis domain
MVMASDSSRSQSNRSSLRVSSLNADGVSKELPFKRMARARTIEGVFNAFKEIGEERGVVLCRVGLTCGGQQQEFTFAEARAENVHECDIGVDGGQTRLLASLSSPNGEVDWRKVDETVLMAAYLIDRLNLQTRLGMLSKQHVKGSAATPRIEGLRGESKAIRELSNTIFKIAPSTGPALLLGESGSGKGVIAKWIHKNSPRAGSPFMSINCANLPAELIESELFGHEKGAFTGAVAQREGLFEQAKGGTIFLDEIGEIDLKLQSKLLKVLEDGEYRRVGGNRTLTLGARVIAATNRNLRAEVDAGRFRLDLYYRLAVIRINIPPLRERGDDLFLIADHHIQRLNRELNRQMVGLAPEVIDLFRRYKWPGNVRELLHAIEQAMTLEESDIITIAHLPEEIINETAAIGRIEYPAGAVNEGDTLQQHLDRHGLQITQLALDKCEGRNAKAARMLGLGAPGFINWRRRAMARLEDGDNRKKRRRC